MAIRKVQIPLYIHVIGKLNELLRNSESNYNAELVSGMLVEYRRGLRMLRGRNNTFLATIAPTDGEQVEQIRNEALRMELDTIRDMLEHEEITRSDPKIMRTNVYLMQAESAMA